MRSPILGVMGKCWRSEIRTNRRPTHYFPIPATKVCSILRRLAAVPMSSFEPPIRTPSWGVRVDLGGRKWYQSKSRPHIPMPQYTTRSDGKGPPGPIKIRQVLAHSAMTRLAMLWNKKLIHWWGQAKRRATKIRLRAVGSGIFGHFF